MRLLFIGLILLLSAGLNAQPPENKMSKEEYIRLYKDIAIKEMNTFGIPASITLAQGILESSSGNSELARRAHNHFGIKCHKGWKGKTMHMDDDSRNECFRKYKNPFDSFKDHSIFLSSRDRYAFLFDLEITDYKAWAKGLKRAGYATNPKYPQLLIKLIEDYRLFEYDQGYRPENYAYKKHQPQITKQAGDDFKPIYLSEGKRQVYENNGVKFIYALKGDSFYSIAQDFNIYTWQVYKYNELKKKDQVHEGQMLYLERKKTKAQTAFHIVQPGERLFDISQKYGVRLKKLCKYNHLDKNAQLFPDQRIRLR